jgi:hypothetical protein
MAHLSKDVLKLAITIANYASRSSFMTRTPHMKGEEVFGSAKHNIDFSLRVDDESQRFDYINFS